MRVFLARLGAVALFLIVGASLAAAADSGVATPALWRVHNGGNTLYLFGSLHILPPDFRWRSPEIEAAMAASDVFIFEVPVDEAALAEEKAFIIEHGFLQGRQSLRGLLTENEFRLYSAILKRAGLKRLYYERYRPWLAAVMVGLAYLHGRNIASLTGADDVIKDYARDNGRELVYLESAREQMSLLRLGSPSGQLKALKQLLISLPRSRQQEREVRETWGSGDAQAFAALIDGYFAGRPEAQELLINRRNRNWLEPLKQVLNGPRKTAMVTVGAAHLGGREGLVALLCQAGYRVEQIAGARPAGGDACGAGASA